jgi:hypothetical protein
VLRRKSRADKITLNVRVRLVPRELHAHRITREYSTQQTTDPPPGTVPWKCVAVAPAAGADDVDEPEVCWTQRERKAAGLLNTYSGHPQHSVFISVR